MQPKDVEARSCRNGITSGVLPEVQMLERTGKLDRNTSQRRKRHVPRFSHDDILQTLVVMLDDETMPATSITDNKNEESSERW